MTFFVTFVRKLTMAPLRIGVYSAESDSTRSLSNDVTILMDELKDMDINSLNPLLFLHTPTVFADKTRGDKRSGCCVPKHYNYMSPPGNHFYSLYELVDFFQPFQRHSKKNITMSFMGTHNQESQRCCKQYLLSRIPMMQERSFLFKNIDEMFEKTQFYDFIYFEISNQRDSMDLLLALFRVLKCKGNCVLKFLSFETLMEMEVVYILTSLFESVHLSKPNASAPFSNERFLIGTNFLMNKCKVERSGFFQAKVNSNAPYNRSFLDIAAMPVVKPISENTVNEPSGAITTELNKSMQEMILLLTQGNEHISLRNGQPLPIIFMNKIRQFNVMIAQMQQDIQFSILNSLTHHQKHPMISLEEYIERNSVTKCIDWCNRHKIQVNPFLEVSTSLSSGFPYSSKQGLHFG